MEGHVRGSRSVRIGQEHSGEINPQSVRRALSLKSAAAAISWWKERLESKDYSGDCQGQVLLSSLAHARTFL